MVSAVASVVKGGGPLDLVVGVGDNGVDLGDPVEAAIIIREGEGGGGRCGGDAYFRPTVGARSCPACGALRLVNRELEVSWR